jgi:hypothetical protein
MRTGERTGQHDAQIRQAVTEIEAALRERFGDDHPLLRPDVHRGTLSWQAAAWALDNRLAAR